MTARLDWPPGGPRKQDWVQNRVKHAACCKRGEGCGRVSLRLELEDLRQEEKERWGEDLGSAPAGGQQVGGRQDFRSPDCCQAPAAGRSAVAVPWSAHAGRQFEMLAHHSGLSIRIWPVPRRSQ